MPPVLALLAATQGGVFGLFPIMWIVFTAILLYQITVVSGRFEDLRSVFALVSDDPRVQAMLIAFCFGGLLEALAGFGAPVAITGVMLMAIGFSALRAAIVVLVANTAPVAFGAIAIPIITAGNLTKIPYQEIGAYVGHQTPILAAFVPLILVLLADGKRGFRQLWPVALVTGLAFAIAQWISATWLSVELTDIIASLVGLAAAVGFLRFWKPEGAADALATLHADRDAELASMTEKERAALPTLHEDKGTAHLDGGRIFMALFPYLLVIAVFSVTKLIDPVKNWMASTDIKIPWPGLDGHVLTASGTPSASTIYNFQWFSSPGTSLLISMVIVAIVYRVSAGEVIGEIWAHPGQAALLDPDGGVGAGAGLRDELLRPDHHHRHLDRRHRRGLRLLLAGAGLDRHRGDRLGHVGQRAVQHAAADGRPAGRHRSDPAGGGEHLRRRGRQDDQPAEPDHRGHRRRAAGPRVRHPAQGDLVEPRHARRAVPADRAAVHPGAQLDAAGVLSDRVGQDGGMTSVLPDGALPDGTQRVSARLAELGHPHAPQLLSDSARTAQDAADALGVELGQIVKSIIFRRRSDDAAVLVMTSGDRRVDEAKVAAKVGELARADAAFVKAATGFSIGGVSPVAHSNAERRADRHRTVPVRRDLGRRGSPARGVQAHPRRPDPADRRPGRRRHRLR